MKPQPQSQTKTSPKTQRSNIGIGVDNKILKAEGEGHHPIPQTHPHTYNFYGGPCDFSVQIPSFSFFKRIFVRLEPDNIAYKLSIVK